MPFNKDEVGLRFRRGREALGRTIESVAIAIAATVDDVSRVERGDFSVPVEILDAMATELGVPLMELLQVPVAPAADDPPVGSPEYWETRAPSLASFVQARKVAGDPVTASALEWLGSIQFAGTPPTSDDGWKSLESAFRKGAELR